MKRKTKIMENEDYLCHHGVLGMKWGRRKQRPKSSGVKRAKKSSNKSNAKKQKILTDSRKQTIKKVAKTTAKVTGAVAATALLGSIGSMAYSELLNHYSTEIEIINDKIRKSL